MKLTRSSMYALQALAHLASLPHPILSRALAQDLAISPTYLTKVLQTLRLAGILAAIRGTNGGFRLNKSPSQISLRSVIELFEDLNQWDFCPFSNRICKGDHEKKCLLHPKWLKVSQAFSTFINDLTVADLSHFVIGGGRRP